MFSFDEKLEYKIEEPGIYIVSYIHTGYIDNSICCLVAVNNYNMKDEYIEPFYIFGDDTKPYAFKYNPYNSTLKRNKTSGLIEYSLIKLF